ncbi:MAG: efflux RND transporter permease subunit, partial [Nevskiales bacterium]
MTAWLGRYCDLVLARPWLLLLASLLLVAVAGLGLTQLSYTSDYRVYFSKDNPERVALEAMENDFIRSESVLIAVAPQDGEVFHVDTLKALQTLTREGAKLPYARAAYSITNVYEAQAEGLNISTATIMPDLPLQAIDLQALKDRAMANDQLRNGLLSDSGDVAAVVVYIELPYDNPTAEVARVAEATEALADRVAAEHPGLQIHLTGLVMFNHALAEAFDRDFSYLYPAAYLVMFVLVGLFFRSWSSMAGTVAVVLMALLFANGMTGWLGIQLNTTSIASGIIILTLAVANCVHLLTTFTHERQAGQAPKPAMREALRVNFQPIFLTNLTTAIGFLCMNFSDAPPNQDLGNIVSIGIVAAFLFSISFL